MKILNPKFVNPDDAVLQSKKAAINVFLNSLPANQESVSADDIRAAFPADAAILTDGMIDGIITSLGFKKKP